MSQQAITIAISNASSLLGSLDEFSEILLQSVSQGASIGFVQPFALEDARAFWLERVVPVLKTGTAVLFEAHLDERVVGTVQLVLPQMPNQTHKAEVAKMMVHPGYRRRGVAGALLDALLVEASARGLKMLTLDTRSGDDAQGLYADRGFEVAGEIPRYARHPHDPERLEGTTYMYKWIGG